MTDIETTGKPFAGYVRISRTNARSGPAFISPDVQRDTIEHLAAVHRLEVAEIVEERDVSGKTPIEERALGRLVERVESGELGGLLVWKVSRYSRNLLDGVTVAHRISSAGGRIVGSDLDTSQPMGKAVLGFLLGWAEEELDARRSGWRDAQRRAADRGAWLSRAPIGYSKDALGVLVPNADAPMVSTLFRMRAGGSSLNELVAYAREHATVPIHKDGRLPSFSRASVSAMLEGTVYLGDIINGDIVEREKHPALIDRRTFDMVAARRMAAPRTGSIAGQGVLLGLVHCRACGKRMTRGAGGPKGRRTVFYTCSEPAYCPAPASVGVHVLDALVLPQIEQRVAAGAVDMEAMLEAVYDAQVAQTRAQRQMDDLVETGLDAFDSARDYAEAVNRARSALLEAATAHSAALDAQDALVRPSSEIEEQRAVAAQLVERVTVGRATRGPGGWQAVGERVVVKWR